MRLWMLPVVAAVALWSAGCVQGPLVDFGNRDKPFVDIKVGQDDAGAARKDTKDAKDKKDKKSSDKSSDTSPF
jgi:hypothetical protein